MKKHLLLSFLFFFAVQLHAADYYWVGGGGNWSDLNHWRLGSSNGSVPSIVPSAGDNVIFGSDAGFGTTAATRTVVINGNAFCNNMIWENSVSNNPILSGAAANKINVYGNLTLAPTVTYNTIGINFLGTGSVTLTTNGVISGTMSLTVNKPNGEVTLADDLIYTAINTATNTLDIVAGHLNAQEKQLSLYNLLSNNNNNRSLNLSNAILNLSIGIDIRGSNKTLDATGSVITAARFYVDSGIFNVVNLGTASSSYLAINNTTFRKLTFTNTSPGSTARIHSNNIVDSLFFKGSGSIRENTNTVNHVVFDGDATIGGSGNIIKYAELHGKLDIINQGNNVFDTLLTAPNKNILITRTNTINKYFRAGGLSCDGFTEINGAGAGTLAFGAGAKVEMDNVLLTNLSAAGPNTPIAVNGIDNGDNSGFTITEPTEAGQTLYWVGGAGDWNDKAHWSTSSGGSGGACIPFINDNVVFDGNSGFSAGNNTVTTSGNTYCNDMTWASGISGNPVFTTNTSFLLRVYGSVVLNPSVTMNARLDIVGTKSGTLTTNGSTLGTNRIIIRKSDTDATSGLTLIDDWDNTSGRFDFLRGVLDLQNRKLSISEFVSSGSSGRNLKIDNADITVYNWTYMGTNITMSSSNSKILVTNNMVTRDLVYDVVDCSATHSGFDIRSTTFDQLTFSNPSLTSGARISDGNTIRRLEFKGQGMIRFGGNIIESLITAENRNFSFYEGSNTITKYFKATHPSCTGLGEIRTGGTTSTLVFGADAEIDIANVYMENISATGGGGTLQLPIAFNGADAGGNTGWTISSGGGNTRYWIGGGGDWNDASHWSETSGGTGGACIPTVNNDVYFDGNSGFGTTVASRTITVNNGNAYFHNMSWAGASNNPILTKASAWAMESWGNELVLNPTVTLNISALQLKGSKATILSGQTLGDFDLDIKKPGGSLTIANDYSNKNTDFHLYEGDFNATGVTLNIASIDNNSRSAAMSVNIEGSTINGTWRFNGPVANHTLLASNSVINSPDVFLAEGFSYNIVNNGSATSTNINFNNTSIDKLTFTNPSSTSTTGINGNNNILGTVEYKGSGVINGTANQIDTLIFFPGSNYTLTNGTNNTITGEWFGSGTPCKPTEIKSNSASASASLTKTSGSVDFDYVRLTRIAATGGATFTAGEHSTDLGGNSGWDIAPYDGASPILGLGPDIGLKTSELPYTIKTDGFFGSPLSQYEWKKDGNIVGTGNELVIMEPGTYSVNVNFPDGCSISDDITISLVSADLSIVKTVDNSTPAVGDNVVFTLVAHNDGPGAGTDVTVTDKLPAGYTFVSDAAPAGTTYDAATGLWTIGNLALDTDLTLTITALVNTSGPYLNEATITGTSDDPEPDNNSSSVALVPSSAVIMTQPSCEIKTGTIEVSEVIGGTYSIDGGITFLASNIFTDLRPGDYSIVVKIGDDTSAPVVVTINEAPITPDAPISGGDQEVCAMSPIQTLTATAKAAAGSTVKWYDALTDGTEVANPTLNTVGTVTYYAEAYNGSCVSETRTAVTLTINESPALSIHNPAVVCHPGLVDLTDATITNGSTVGLDFTYFEDENATIPLTNPSAVSESGIYYIIGTNPITGCSSIAPVVVQFVDKPEVIAVHPDCVSGTGSISITSPIGPDFEYSIDGGLTYQTETSYTGLLPGTYEVKAQNIAVPGCESDVTIVIINSTPTTAMPVVIQPDCDQALGTIEFPVNADYEYSIDGGIFEAKHVFTDLIAGTYTLRSKKAGDACIADAVEVVIVASESRPDQPVSLGDIEVCETYAAQEIEAEVSYPAGVTIIWYDAPTGGNMVSSPTLSTVGSVTYYAEASNGTCSSATRTAVTLTIVPVPVIYPIADINSCEAILLPPITGANLSGNEAYYTQPNGGGEKYNAGGLFSELGQTTLYAYGSVTAPGLSCPAEQEFNVFIQSVTEGIIGTEQTICKNTVPLPLGSIVDGTGSNVKYRWEKSTTSASAEFTAISGIVSATYTPFIPLNTTTYFRRIAISTLNGITCESSPTAVVTITVQDEVTAGRISADQTICHGSIPAPLTSVSDGTGSGTISYRWESSTTDALTGFTPIVGAVAAVYNPDALTETTFFRRITISTEDGVVCESDPTTAVKITVQDVVTTGGIGADQTICINSVPMELTSTGGGTGSGTISYRWEQSSELVPAFTPIAGAESESYTPGTLTKTTYYRRITISTLNGIVCESEPTSLIKITVQDEVTGGSINGDQIICFGSIPAPMTSVLDGTGSGTISYRWESSTTDALTGFTPISSAVAADYNPVALTETTFFRRVAISTEDGVVCESDPTTAVKITVQDVAIAGDINGDQAICNGNIPAPLTSVSDGTGSGTISYRWESSTTDALTGFTPIAGAVAAVYSPEALIETTFFRRVAISTEDGVVCESEPTTAVKIIVVEELFANAGDTQIKHNSPVFNLNAEVPTIGDGKWTVVSGTLDQELTDDTNAQAIVNLRPNSSVTLRWTVSKMDCSVYDEVTLTYITEADLVTMKFLKDPAQATFVPGEDVVYTITVSNNGPSNAQNVNIKDLAPTGSVISTWAAIVTSGTVSLPNIIGTGDLDETIGTLPNGAKVTYEVTVKTPSDFAGDLINTVSVSSDTDDPNPSCDACETVPLKPEIAPVLPEENPQLEFWKTGTYHDLNSNGKVDVGDVVNYSFTVSNIGNVRIDDIRVQDPMVAVIGGPISLEVGASDATTFTAAYDITQADIDKGSIHNLATAIAKDPSEKELMVSSKDPNSLEPNDPTTITLLETVSQMELVKTVTNEGTGENGVFLPGDVIHYQFVATNTGTVTLVDVVMGDPMISDTPIMLTSDLLPGVSVKYTATYTVGAADADRGYVLNQATVKAKDSKGILLEVLSGTVSGNNDPTRTPISEMPPVSNIPPSAVDDRSETESGKTVIINVNDNDKTGSSELDLSSIEIIDGPVHGTVIVNLDGTMNYTPDAGFVGDDAFTYRIRDVNGIWSNVAKVTITMHANALLIPNVFTPNGDGRNDTFVILGLEGYDKAELTIFNRWGNEVYRNSNYKNNWDGGGLNEATYYYLIVLKKEGKENVHKGWVLLKR